MDSNLVQALRYKLQKRFQTLNSVNANTFHFSLVRLWGFLERHEVIGGVMNQLALASEKAKTDLEAILAGTGRHGKSEWDQIAIAYQVLKHCQASSDSNVELSIALVYRTQHDVAFEQFKAMFVDPLYEYIDEQLNEQRAILGLLRKYKHRCEWFRRAQLLALYTEAAEHRNGEKALSSDLYEYLHDQGIRFSIEPTSVSGEADLIAARNSDDPLVADVKIFDPTKNKGKAYIVYAFQQVYQYALDYNESFGYLVIFKTCEEGLGISTSHQEQSTPFVIHNGKVMFFVVIDLFAHKKSASQRGKLRTYEITEQDLVTKRVDNEDAEDEA